MKKLIEYIHEAEKNKVAIGHFNFANLDGLWAIFDAVRELSAELDHPFEGGKIPVLVGVSGGERKFVGVVEAALLVQHFRKTYDYPIFLNADHNYDVESCKEAIDAGYDMVIIDGAKVSHEENLQMTKDVVAYRDTVNPACLVEAELGFIGMGSDMKDELPEGVSEETMTKPDEAKVFVEETKIDLLAPAIGNVHGMIKSGNPALSPARVAEVRTASGIPQVLHGGSGSADADIVASVKAGISVIHINTELRLAYRSGVEQGLAASDAAAPYKWLAPGRDAMKEKVKNLITLFLS